MMLKIIIFLSLILPVAHGTIIIPNQYSVPIGERGGVLGGAVVARVDDASSAHYNPAGLSLLPRDTFSASGSTYSSSNLEITGSESDSSFDSIASYVANVWKIGNYHFAFSAATPNYTSILLQKVSSIPDRDLNVTENYDTGFNIISPGISISRSYSSTLRMGLSLKVLVTNIKDNGAATLLANSTLPNSSIQVVASNNITLDSKSIRIEYGIQKDLDYNLRFGLMLKSPTFKVGSGGKYISNSFTRFADGSSEYTSTNEQNLDFDFSLPPELHVGLAIVETNWDFEVDLKYNHSQKSKSFSKTMIKSQVIKRNTAGTITVITDEFDNSNGYYNFKKTLNYSASYSIRLGTTYLVSASYFTNKSPTKRIDVEEDLFTAIDLTGGTLGITKFGKVVSTTLGLFINQGSTSYTTKNLLDEDTLEYLRYRTLGLSLSGSVYY